ncbi:McrB family protein [Sporosarcina sp. Marseille-Q4063]|uniref:McrB family protein n=1 Tax=Sporosarcina sp. Marseille-Q4063 TaxID=2810514 RepID=UPI00201660AA|nr:AAA family ATPase [Sporosarcina sp. Marseille-Q4063]
MKDRNIKYYCAVYSNRIIEVYELTGSTADAHPENEGRTILEGELANKDIRNQLLSLDVSSIHTSSGNPIKYTKLETLFYLKEHGSVPTEDVVTPIEPEPLRDINLVSNIHSYISSKGFNYSLSNIKNLYLSIRSKPFVIISGISGTGKTKVVQLFAESLGATEENGQFKLIPVRPDWTDGSELLGYPDLKNEFQKGPLTEMVEHAMDRPDSPHFVLLDEMNLARVEYYFSDVLSVMESRKRDGDRITTSYLLDKKFIGHSLRLPENLYIIGTVNMDETTHPFSKKVLDRANTIEFNEIYLENFDFLGDQELVEMQRISNKQLAANYISLKDVYSTHRQLIEDISRRLSEINDLLEPLNAHIGYRVRDEICFYMVHNTNMGLLEEYEAFDYCLMQKILPRITGSDGRIDKLLNDLFEWLSDVPYDAENVLVSSKYPRSAKKVAEMLRRYHLDGFTSFWIS